MFNCENNYTFSSF